MFWLRDVPFNYYTQIVVFCAIHIYRICLGWIKTRIIEPLDEILNKYAKHEPTATQWIQVYNLTTAHCITNLDTIQCFFGSDEYYMFPCTKEFSTYVNNEIEHVMTNGIQLPKYDPDLKQVPDVLESLIVTRIEEQYTFHSFPVLTSARKDRLLPYNPVKSSIEFVFVEYTHPKMYEGIIFNIPIGYYMNKNELFSPAFIQRYLELQKKYYIFDNDYQVDFIDHLCEKHSIDCSQYILISEDSYQIKTITIDEDNDENDDIDENDDNDENDDTDEVKTEPEERLEQVDYDSDDDYSIHNMNISGWIFSMFS